MNIETIGDAYDANDKIHERLVNVLSSVGDGANVREPGEKWSIAEIVEHIAMVNEGTTKICTKLVREAKPNAKAGTGRVTLSDSFGEKAKQIATLKVDAPERVQPTGGVDIPTSLARMDAAGESMRALRTDLETLDVSGHTFPHPFFGDITAVEWLVLGGQHELRHTKQIERLLETSGREKARSEGG